MLTDLRIDQLPEVGFQAFMGSFLIRAHQARIADHIGGEDRGETADREHVSGRRQGGLNRVYRETRGLPSVPIIRQLGSVHTAGVSRLALRIGRVLPLLWSSRYGGAPSERQHHEEHGKRAGPSHAITLSAVVSACFSARPSSLTLWSDRGCHQDSAGGTVSQPSFPERRAAGGGVRGRDRRIPWRSAARFPAATPRAAHPREVCRSLLPPADPVRAHRGAEDPPMHLTWEC